MVVYISAQKKKHLKNFLHILQQGKMSRMLAAKAALACRYDALGEETTTEMGIENHSKLSSRMSMLETGYSRKLSGKAKSQSAFASYHGTR